MNLTNDQFQEWTKAHGLSHAIGRAFWGTLPQELEGKDLPFRVEGDAVSFRVVRLGNLAGGYAPGIEFNFWEVPSSSLYAHVSPETGDWDGASTIWALAIGKTVPGNPSQGVAQRVGQFSSKEGAVSVAIERGVSPERVEAGE